MKRIVTLAAGGLILVAAAPAANAATTGPSAADLTAARQAASASTSTLGRFFAANGGPDRHDATLAAKMAPKLSGPTVPVYELAPGFVTGKSGDVARLAYLSTEAVATNGQKASVWTVRTATGWTVANIASGADEEVYAKHAGLVFHEPQLNAWYTLSGGKVAPLNTEARQTLGAASLPLSAYQRLVHQRYAGKMPGSSYDRKGMAGGYGPSHGKKGSPLPAVLGGAFAVALAGGLTARRLIRR